MIRRFTLVRLLLLVILINTVLISLFVFDADRLSTVLPGHFGAGAESWGNYVFVSLLFLINAVLILGAGFAVVIPTLLDRLAISPSRLKGILTNRAGVSSAACEAVVTAVREEQEEERAQLLGGRWVFRIGALFFILAFPALCFSFARADASGTPLFADTHGNTVANANVEFNDVVTYTADQVFGAVALDAPEIFAIRFSPLTPNLGNTWMPMAAFLFRAIVGLILVTGLLAIFRGAVLRSYTRKPEVATLPKPETPPGHAEAFAPQLESDAHSKNEHQR